MRRLQKQAELPMTEFSQNPPQAMTPPGGEPIRVVLVIPSRLERLGWGIVVESQDDMELLGQFSSLHAGLTFLASHPVDVALIDEGMLTPKHCITLQGYTAQRRSRILLIASHPADDQLADSQYSFASDRLLKGVAASSLLAAIRGQQTNDRLST